MFIASITNHVILQRVMKHLGFLFLLSLLVSSSSNGELIFATHVPKDQKLYLKLDQKNGCVAVVNHRIGRYDYFYLEKISLPPGLELSIRHGSLFVKDQLKGHFVISHNDFYTEGKEVFITINEIGFQGLIENLFTLQTDNEAYSIEGKDIQSVIDTYLADRQFVVEAIGQLTH